LTLRVVSTEDGIFPTEQACIMNKLCIFIGMSALGWVGWWLGEKIGIMTAFVVSGIASMAGAYAGWRINRDYFQ